MIPLETAVDPLAFESWEQITALLIIVTGGIAWKWLSSMSSHQKATGETVDQIKSTLTTNNGGSHIKDQLDRIEKVQLEQAKLWLPTARSCWTTWSGPRATCGRPRSCWNLCRAN